MTQATFKLVLESAGVVAAILGAVAALRPATATLHRPIFAIAGIGVLVLCVVQPETLGGSGYAAVFGVTIGACALGAVLDLHRVRSARASRKRN